jgi:hypothetical protein
LALLLTAGLLAAGAAEPSPSDPCLGPVCVEACGVYKVYQEILARQGGPLGGLLETARLLQMPEISTEGLDGLRQRFATTTDPKAKKINAEGPSGRSASDPAPTPLRARKIASFEISGRSAPDSGPRGYQTRKRWRRDST